MNENEHAFKLLPPEVIYSLQYFTSSYSTYARFSHHQYRCRFCSTYSSVYW
jgi:hypothetical protein